MEELELPAWQQKLKEEYKETKEKLDNLDKFLKDKNTKLNLREWHMIEGQRNALSDYYWRLKDRCDYYDLL